MALTVKELGALKPVDHGRRLTDGGSLKGKVYAARDGTVSVQFRFAYKLRSKAREVLVGTWPKAGLAEIRRERDALRVLVQSGADPVEHNQTERHQKEVARQEAKLRALADSQEAVQVQQLRLEELARKNARLNVRSLFEQWQRLELAQRADKGSEAQRSFNRDVFPIIGELAAEDVTKTHIQLVVDTVKSRATPARNMVRTAKKTLADLRQMFGFAMDRDYVAADPTARVKKARIGTDVERDRVLEEPELVLLFQKLPEAGLERTSQFALKLQLATITRIGEVLGARWEHVDFDRRLWTFPETKNGRRHSVWLSDYALEQLQGLRTLTGATLWLFPASRTNVALAPAAHICVKTVTKQVGDRQRVDTPSLAGRSRQVAALVLPGGKWTPHDLRRTGATMMAELGTLPDVIEKCLNHTEEQKIKRIYQRAPYESAMRDAWRRLGDQLALLQKRAAGAADVAMLRTG